MNPDCLPPMQAEVCADGCSCGAVWVDVDYANVSDFAMRCSEGHLTQYYWSAAAFTDAALWWFARDGAVGHSVRVSSTLTSWSVEYADERWDAVS